MNYQETLSWLYEQFPFYQQEGSSAYKKDINNVLDFFNRNGKQYLLFDTIHVGGTNGKGSVSHMLSSIFQESGFKVGLFTSPHLIHFRERIKINNNKISQKFIVQFVKKYQQEFKNINMSFFEINVAMAFNYFAQKKVDIAIIEVGLGGRLDATNVILPKLSVITNISIDHTNLLGNNIEYIAIEKAGIVKQNTPILIGENKNYGQLIEDKANTLNSPVFYSKNYNYDTDLLGVYQKKNINTAVTAVNILNNYGYKVSENHIINGLKKIVYNTGLIGRWQIVSTSPLVICDIAHNRNALNLVFKEINQLRANRKYIIIGLSKDKDIDTIIKSLPKDYYYYICGSSSPRIMTPSRLAVNFKKYNLKYKIYNSSIHAYKEIYSSYHKDDVIMITGSTFVISDILKFFNKI